MTDELPNPFSRHDAPDAPDNRFYDEMNELAVILDDFLNHNAKGLDRKVGFCLMVFPFGPSPGERCNYISNAVRSDMIALLRDQLRRLEKRGAQ